jgi:hypothetical protein
MSIGSDVMRTYIVNVLWRRPWLTFLLMGVSFLLFGVMTVNIFVLLKANLDLYVNYGTMVIADGALLQLAELIGYGYLSMLLYVLFKACEHVLVRHLTCEPRNTRPALRDITEKSQQSL